MILGRRVLAFAARFAKLALTPTAIFLIVSTACTNGNRTPVPGAPVGWVQVVGTLLALKDDRPVDGGVDLTLETARGVRELVRVPSAFIAPPRDSVLAMHRVVDAAKLGDRLRARGTRDETGALRAETLELLPH
jgi:hypothetical protein